MTNFTNKAKQPVRFWPYTVCGSFMLLIFVSAIIAPDYFNYKIRVAKVESATKITANIAAAVTATNAAMVATNISLLQSTCKTVTDSLMSPTMEAKSSEIFDTYGKLITMLLGFVSVLGVFFGYFVRKSLREAEEDLREHVKLNMDLWEKEKNRLSGDVTSKLAEIEKYQEIQKTQRTEFDKIIENSKKALEALEAAAKSEEQKLTGNTTRTATAAAAIDADNTVPPPPA